MKKLILGIMMSILAGGAWPALGAAVGPEISATVGLSSFMALSDGHLQKMADSLKILAQQDVVRTGDWEKIRGPLQQVASLNVEAVNWFALPNGNYWTLQQGPAGNLSDRPYWPQLLKGQTVMGALVVSRSTGEDTTIVAVPVYGADGKLVGALGASVYLDKLSDRLRDELGVTNEIFYSFDSSPLIAVNWDPALIFADPTQLGPELSQVVNDMLTKSEGTESNTFR
ncbi:MAG: PDC sensor domain-containing protein, partial [Bdellovibrionota bacterium]